MKRPRSRPSTCRVCPSVNMKQILLLLSLVAGLAVVQGQSGNIFLDSFDSAMTVKELYDEETDYFRQYLTYEAEDLGNFADFVAYALELSSTPAHGAGIQQCAEEAHYYATINVEFFNYYILEAEEAARDLQFTVMGLIRDKNIKEDLPQIDLFYYYHDYIVQEAYEDLYYYYGDNMFYAWLIVYLEWFYIYDELDYCMYNAIYG